MTSVSPAASSTERDYAGRQAPWSSEAEQAVLGAMLLDQDTALKAAELLDDTMFYREAHRLLYRAMTALTERGDVIDPVTLREELGKRGDLDRAGGMEYLGSLDRKSTRLNSSHGYISYAVFCLKKKKRELPPSLNERAPNTPHTK